MRKVRIHIGLLSPMMWRPKSNINSGYISTPFAASWLLCHHSAVKRGAATHNQKGLENVTANIDDIYIDVTCHISPPRCMRMSVSVSVFVCFEFVCMCEFVCVRVCL